MLIAKKAMERLGEGNLRYLRGFQRSRLFDCRRKELISGPALFAAIFSGSDFRVPPELVFDQGLGDLFVVRGADNVVDPALIGSVEYAVANLSARLVLVLGHSNCGALAATVDELQQSSGDCSLNVASLVECIRPTAETRLQTEIRNDRDELIRQSVRGHVQASVEQLKAKSAILRNRIDQKRTWISPELNTFWRPARWTFFTTTHRDVEPWVVIAFICFRPFGQRRSLTLELKEALAKVGEDLQRTVMTCE